MHGARQDWDDAIAAYGEVLKLDPRVNGARLELARLSLVKGKPDDAIQFAQEALRAQPGLVEATMILGRAMLTERRLWKGRAAREAARETVPEIGERPG